MGFQSVKSLEVELAETQKQIQALNYKIATSKCVKTTILEIRELSKHKNYAKEIKNNINKLNKERR